MWSLIHTELTRLRWRKAVIALLAAMVLVPGIIVVSHAWNTRPVSASDITQAEREIEESRTYSIQDCVEHPRNWGVSRALSDEQTLAKCERRAGDTSTVEDWIYRPPLTIRGFLDDSGLGILTVLGLLAALIGTTYVGHDWASRSMSNQLLFESRRGRVWLAKAAALLLTVAVTTAAVLGMVWLTVWGLIESRDIVTAPGMWEEAAWTQVRGLGLIVGMALGSYAITMWFRSTVGALGLIIGVGVVSSIVLVTILGPEAIRWLVSSNALAVLQNGYQYYDETKAVSCADRGPCDETSTLSAQAGAIYLAALLLVVAIPSFFSFRRRDVP